MEWWLVVVGLEPVAELGISDEVVPPLADGYNLMKGGRRSQEADEDLFEDIIVF